ncbi:MAG: hypothetical protein ACI3X7_02785 [Bacteroidaceae bacterium]
MKKILILSLLLQCCVCAWAETWDEVVNSGEYYYGVGTGATQEEADQMAWSEMLNSIVVHVSSDFVMLHEETGKKGEVDSKTKVMNCMKTYSQGTFTNVESMTRGKAPSITVLRYMKRSELQNIYAHRIEAAKSWASLADEALDRRKVDMALQYYYWAYAFIRSLQRPYEVKDQRGNALATVLPSKIREILGKIDVRYEGQDEEFVNLLFLYDGKPLSSIDFSYNDGQADNEGCRAQDGRGCMEMAQGYKDKTCFDVAIEYENKGCARGDAELQSVLAVVPKTFFPEASHKVMRSGSEKVTAIREKGSKETGAKGTVSKDVAAKETTAAKAKEKDLRQVDAPLRPSASQKPDNADMYQSAMARIVEAMRKGSYHEVESLFDIDGLEVFRQIRQYGTARLVGEQNITFFKGVDGTVTARGMNVNFSFTTPKKATFTENLVFTFNKEGKICNVSFGLGKVAEQDILCRNASWGNEVKAQLMEFMENYKTAYCLRRLEYIKDIFADDAVIIVGRVTHRHGGTTNIGERQVSQFGHDIITHNRYTKDQYLKQLERCFKNPRNKYINVKFAENDIQTLKSFDGHKVYGIQIKQLYDSATYGDVGYLFLMVDMTDPDKPQIKVRTWQPNETPMDQLYSSGDFYM